METRKSATLYIDAANLIMTARDFELEYDICMLLQFLKDTYRADRCVYFTARFKNLSEDYEYLKSLGVEVVYKEMYSEDGKLKANCDVEISHRITKDLENNLTDGVVLLTGDGDFYSLLKYAQNVSKKKVSVFAIVPKKTSRLYKNGSKFNLSYLFQIIEKVSKRKALTEHVRSARVLFGTDSLPNPTNLSSIKSEKFIVIYTTFKGREEGDKIVNSLIESKIIACANFLSLEARYFWEGKVANVSEVGVLLKTRLGNWESVKKEIEKIHSYKIPCIIKFEVESNKSYADWIKEETISLGN